MSHFIPGQLSFSHEAALEALSLPGETQPFNIRIMDVDAYIKENNLGQVTSLATFEPSTTLLAPDGLFSEEIFGQVGSENRIKQFGYIELNTPVIAPVLYKHLLKLSGDLYDGILRGEVYAVFDPETKDFRRVFGDPEDTPDANTGFSFFLSHFHEINFERTGSDVRNNRIALIERYRDVALYRRCLVLPAGLRDIQVDGDRMIQDDINKLYAVLLSLSFAMPENAASTVFDSVRYKIQLKVTEIYNYIENIMTGKRGFLQGGGYGRRRIALGTRNVLTAATYAMEDPSDPQAIKPNETKVGIFQTAKGLQPLVIHYLKAAFFDPILGDNDSAKVALTNPKTLKLEYVYLSSQEKDKFATPDALEKWINRFRNKDIRFNPVNLTDVDGKEFHLCLIYDQGDTISLFRTIDDLKAHLDTDEIDLDKVRPLTWSELLYMATYNASHNRHVMITRYPVIEEGSSYPSKIHLCSTLPARMVKMFDLITSQFTLEYPQYPILGKTFMDSLAVHASSLGGLGGDWID